MSDLAAIADDAATFAVHAGKKVHTTMQYTQQQRTSQSPRF
jgi:hypothetical protein